MTELAKKWNPKLYPELEQAGGLPQALQPHFSSLSGELVAEGLDQQFIVYASATRALRSSQVMIAAKQRAFSADFWNQGVQYGSGWAASLEEVARAIHAFLVDGIGAESLGSRFSWVNVNEQSLVHERGAAAFVEYEWQGYLEWLEGEPAGSSMALLLPLVCACMERPRLRSLMPYTSHDRLCFSRTTGYPYSSECPAAFPVAEGRFRMGADPSFPSCRPRRHAAARALALWGRAS